MTEITDLVQVDFKDDSFFKVDNGKEVSSLECKGPPYEVYVTNLEPSINANIGRKKMTDSDIKAGLQKQIIELKDKFHILKDANAYYMSEIEKRHHHADLGLAGRGTLIDDGTNRTFIDYDFWQATVQFYKIGN